MSRPKRDGMVPRIVALNGKRLQLEAGEYVWCGCGHSTQDPLCDGCSGCPWPQGAPLRFKVESAHSVKLCRCKRSKHPPLCDGTHFSLDPSLVPEDGEAGVEPDGGDGDDVI